MSEALETRKAERNPVVDLIEVVGGDDLLLLKTLFVEYADAFDRELCFEAFDEELSVLPAPYVAPYGGLVLAKVNGQVAGCVALKRLDSKKAEMKRLYVRPGFRGNRLGMRLTNAMSDLAKTLGYKVLQAETVPAKMGFAVSVYRQQGFVLVKQEAGNPIVFMEKTL